MSGDNASRWGQHASALRDPGQIIAQWEPAGAVDPALLRSSVSSGWWDLLARLNITLLVTREYEHLVTALSSPVGRAHVSHMALPHPSGIAVDLDRGEAPIASTRNPNQVYRLRPAAGMRPRKDRPLDPQADRPLLPVASQFFPGALYLHDLALIGGVLHANAVGENAVVALPGDGIAERVWWPRAIETPKGPEFARNHLQVNSIAAGPDLAGSFFSASAEVMGARRPGHANFPADGRGVVFSGATREPIVRGLTRPHSARLDRDRLWVANSGYGEVGVVQARAYEVVARLPGWTRGLCFAGDVAIAATSRVIPRFRKYAPGLDVTRTTCGLQAIHASTGRCLEWIRWPHGNQIFAVEAIPSSFSWGLPLMSRRSARSERMTRLFYGFESHQGASAYE